MSCKALLILLLLSVWALVSAGPVAGAVLGPWDDTPTTIPKSAMGAPALALASAPSAAFSIRAEARVEPKRETYPSNLPLDYIVEARWRGELGAVAVKTPQNPTLENLECERTSVANHTHPESGEASAEFRFTLKPVAQGAAHVGGSALEYSTGPEKAAAALHVDGVDLIIGKPQRDWRRIGAWGGAGAAGVAIVALGGLLFFRRVAHREPEAPPPPSPFEALRAQAAALDRHLIEGDEAAFYGEAREIACKGLALAGLFDRRSPTATEFAQWLDSRPDDEREALRPAQAVLEQAERVRFAAARPTADENRAARKDLEAALSRLEKIAPKEESGEARSS
ncbi:MAG: hypothetical protein NTW86_17785 [Candidatus Sumerlaeota bacterium]|nr:hypothetical protein [Candidatus Sumerlaeota bacterium]